MLEGLGALTKCAAQNKHAENGYTYDGSKIDVGFDIKFCSVVISLPLGREFKYLILFRSISFYVAFHFLFVTALL